MRYGEILWGISKSRQILSFLDTGKKKQKKNKQKTKQPNQQNYQQTNKTPKNKTKQNFKKPQKTRSLWA